jgi:hypothetical protein
MLVLEKAHVHVIVVDLHMVIYKYMLGKIQWMTSWMEVLVLIFIIE